MWKLSSLHCLAIDGSNVEQMPERLSILEKLHSLDMFIVGRVDRLPLVGLRRLPNIGGKLLIKGLENVANVGDAIDADLKERGNLDDLTFKFDLYRTNTFEKERDVLENLRPHANLKKLTVSYYGATSFPSWLVLRVKGMNKVRLVGAEFYGCGTPFRCLEELVFELMEEWEKWIVEGVYFPCLKRLQLSKCPRLRGCLPAHLPSLERLDIRNCQQLEGPLPQLESISLLHLEGCDKVELREIFQLTTLTQLELEKLP
ncbi:hypothetical protein Ancab_022116 [Ancistrocladus abbreviatus]